MRTMNNIKELLKEQIKFTDGYLDKYLAEKDNPQNIIYKAMRYSVFAGGKRLRPILMMNRKAVRKASGKNSNGSNRKQKIRLAA